MQHNNTELTRVRGANPEKPYSMTLDYGGSLEQLGAVIDGSEYCEQEVAYHCKRSRLLNTPGEKLPSWALAHVPTGRARCGTRPPALALQGEQGLPSRGCAYSSPLCSGKNATSRHLLGSLFLWCPGRDLKGVLQPLKVFSSSSKKGQ